MPAPPYLRALPGGGLAAAETFSPAPDRCDDPNVNLLVNSGIAISMTQSEIGTLLVWRQAFDAFHSILRDRDVVLSGGRSETIEEMVQVFMCAKLIYGTDRTYLPDQRGNAQLVSRRDRIKFIVDVGARVIVAVYDTRKRR